MNNHDRPILSIIIATKNRSQYVGACVRSLLGITALDIEIVVQDNSDNDHTATAIAPLTVDRRLVYIHCTDQLSISDNYTKGLEAASGEYIAFLGDDDGVNPELAEAVRWAKTEGLDALVGCSAASYLWPDVIFAIYGKLLSATLIIRSFSGTISYPNPETEIRRCVRRAGYNFGRLPKVYHGVVRREFLDLIFHDTGTYFPGPTLDMATAVALASVLECYAHIDYPLFLPGTGRGSGGGGGTEKKHDWSLESVPWLSHRAIGLWSDLVPRYCCGTTLWAEDVIQALKAMDRDDLLQHFNAVFLYARCAVFNRHHNSQTLATFRQYVRDRRSSRLWSVSAITYYYLLTWLARLSSLASNILMMAGLSRTRRVPNVADIDQAVSALKIFLRANGRHFDERLI